MTLPVERSRAVRRAREFLRDLLDPKKTPKVPRAIREKAYDVLKHFPADYHIRDAALMLPAYFGKVKEDE